jgi:cobalt/nickel transport system permease protein
VALASVLAAVVGLQLGSLFVVFQTVMSGISALPFASFALLMQPIHLAISLVEGFVTAGVVLFVLKAQPDLLKSAITAAAARGSAARTVLVGLLAATVLAGGVLSWFASANPDGLEWSMEGVAGTAELEATAEMHDRAGALQALTAFMPDYAFKSADEAPEAQGSAQEAAGAQADAQGGPAEDAPAWPAVDAGTSTAGLLGAAIVLAIVTLVGYALRRRSDPSRATGAPGSLGGGS